LYGLFNLILKIIEQIYGKAKAGTLTYVKNDCRS